MNEIEMITRKMVFEEPRGTGAGAETSVSILGNTTTKEVMS
ncbi:MAG: hypothetical protein QW478_08500 [Candidatus Micrarchaeaceae archaeon]